MRRDSPAPRIKSLTPFSRRPAVELSSFQAALGISRTAQPRGLEVLTCIIVLS